eukprot:4952459-Prymnesium_polylepis.1
MRVEREVASNRKGREDLRAAHDVDLASDRCRTGQCCITSDRQGREHLGTAHDVDLASDRRVRVECEVISDRE